MWTARSSATLDALLGEVEISRQSGSIKVSLGERVRHRIACRKTVAVQLARASWQRNFTSGDKFQTSKRRFATPPGSDSRAASRRVVDSNHLGQEGREKK